MTPHGGTPGSPPPSFTAVSRFGRSRSRRGAPCCDRSCVCEPPRGKAPLRRRIAVALTRYARKCGALSGRKGAGRTIILRLVVEANYASGDDYVVEFLGYRFRFSAVDFEERVTAAAVRLGLIPDNELDEDETADLVELAADGRIDEPRSGLGRYLVRSWEHIALVNGESLVYWLRKLVFRSAWLDQRVKSGLLDVTWDEATADFGYRDPRGDRALLELAPVPSWHELQFRP
jgi:hypothetical protein